MIGVRHVPRRNRSDDANTAPEYQHLVPGHRARLFLHPVILFRDAWRSWANVPVAPIAANGAKLASAPISATKARGQLRPAVREATPPSCARTAATLGRFHTGPGPRSRRRACGGDCRVHVRLGGFGDDGAHLLRIRRNDLDAAVRSRGDPAAANVRARRDARRHAFGQGHGAVSFRRRPPGRGQRYYLLLLIPQSAGAGSGNSRVFRSSGAVLRHS